MNTPTEPNRNDQLVRNDAPRAEAPVDSQRIKNTFPLAVIELGTSAIRMAIGESDGSLSVRVLEQLVRGVSLGKDTFTNGEIQRKTLQECVKVLKSYRRKLKEYQCTDPKHIRIVATSAVREAANRLEVLDRIYCRSRGWQYRSAGAEGERHYSLATLSAWVVAIATNGAPVTGHA